MPWFALFPATALGSMLIFSGLELASVATAQRGRAGVWVMLFTGAASMATNTFWGFLAGGIVCFALSVHARGGPAPWWHAAVAHVRRRPSDE